MDFKSYGNFLFAGALLLVAIFLTYILYNEMEWYLAIIPLLFVVIGFLVFKTPLDKWGFRFQDVKIDEALTRAAVIEYPVLQSYSEEQLVEFRRRMFYFLYDREAYLVTGESEKLDIYNTMLMSVPAVIMGMGKPFDPCDDIERLAVYTHAFPSPKMKFLHTAEYDEEDGMIILSTEHMMKSLREKDITYHIVYHVWADRLIAQQDNFPQVPVGFMDELHRVFGFGMESIEGILGFKNPPLPSLALTAFYTRNTRLEEIFPDFHREVARYLGL